MSKGVKRVWPLLQNSLPWALIFLGIWNEEAPRTHLGQQILVETGNMNELLELQSWIQSLSGRGQNLIDAIYIVPEQKDERRGLFLELLETGGSEPESHW